MILVRTAAKISNWENEVEVGILIILLSVSSYALIAKRLSTTILTAPIVFLGVGLALSQNHLISHVDAENILHTVAEVSLIILLFLDASQINLQKLRRENNWPIRMLLVGLPLSMLIGTATGMLFFPEWPLVAVALIAAILAPTDAALGQAVVSNEDVPQKERQTLIVESGLNDGLALPIILFFASLLTLMTMPIDHETNWLTFGLGQIILGPLVGAFMGWSGASTFLFAEKRGLTTHTNQGIGTLALTGSTYLVATIVGGNGFIAAFVAGLVFGNSVKGHCRFIYEFTESEGQILVWASFLFIGLGLLPNALSHLSVEIVAYILVSLFLVRPLAIYISLMGSDAKPVTRLFFGWFGPRGLATALFALLVTKEIGDDYSHSILVVAINAVWMSAVLHGVSSAFGARWYAKVNATKIDK